MRRDRRVVQASFDAVRDEVLDGLRGLLGDRRLEVALVEQDAHCDAACGRRNESVGDRIVSRIEARQQDVDRRRSPVERRPSDVAVRARRLAPGDWPYGRSRGRGNG